MASKSSCKAPTEISCSPISLFPGQDFTVTFRGAQAGNGVKIVAYHVLLSFSDNYMPEYTLDSLVYFEENIRFPVSNGATSGTFTVDGSYTENLSKGTMITVKMFTEADDYVWNSGISKYVQETNSGYGWARLDKDPPEPATPSPPQVDLLTSNVVESGERVRFQVTFNANECYYSQYSGYRGGIEIYNSGQTISVYPNSTTTYYFWAENSQYGMTKRSNIVQMNITVLSYPPYAPSETRLIGREVEGIQGSSNAKLFYPSSVQLYNNSSNTGKRQPTKASVTILYSNSYSTVANNNGSIYNLTSVDVLPINPGYTPFEFPASFLNNYQGYYFKIRGYFSNSYGNSETTYNNSIYQIPYFLDNPTITEVVASEEGVTEGYFANSVNISWTNPVVQIGQPNIAITQIIYQSSSNNSSWSSTTVLNFFGTTTSGGENKLTITDNFTPGLYYRFGIRVIDDAGRTKDTFATNSQYVLYRGHGPELSTEVFSVTGPEEDNMVTIRPYTNVQNIVFSSVKAIGDNAITYTIDAYIEEKGVIIPILTNANPTTSEGDTVTFTITAQEINTLLKDPRLKENEQDTVWNNNFSNVRYRIYARDTTGMTSTINSTSNTQIKFIENPTFVEGAYAKVGIQYNAQVTTNKIKMASTTTSGDFNIANERMFNPGEAVFLKFNKATDYNEDITGYRLFVKRLDTKPAIAFDSNYSTGNFEMLKTYSLEELDIDNNEINMLYPVNSYAMNKFLIFAVAAIDSKGNLSKYKYSETYLIGCRIQNATINFDAKVDNTDNKLKFTYTISDLGGSRFVNSQIYTYSQYPNFERIISLNDEVYNKKARISLEYCLDGNFNNTSSNNYGITSIDYDSSTDFESIGSNNGQPITIATDVLNENFLNKKLYSRLVLIMSTGLGTNELEGFDGLSINITYSSVYTYYADAPTVSHRANHVGINTNNFSEDEDEIFIVSDFGMRNKIKFIGTNEAGEAMNIVINVKNGTLIGYDTNNNQTILIDLKNKTIDGAIISGGSW